MDEFAVGALQDLIVGGLSDEPVDVDLDGVTDLVRVQCVVTVETSGTYSLSSTLTNTATGRGGSAGVILDYLPAGASTISLYFRLRDFDVTSRNGTFKVENLRLYRKAGDKFGWRHTYSAQYVTRQYSGSRTGARDWMLY